MFDDDNAMVENCHCRTDNANLRGATTICGVRSSLATQDIFGIFRALSKCKINLLLRFRVAYLARLPAGIVPPRRLTASVANWATCSPLRALGCKQRISRKGPGIPRHHFAPFGRQYSDRFGLVPRQLRLAPHSEKLFLFILKPPQLGSGSTLQCL